MHRPVLRALAAAAMSLALGLVAVAQAEDRPPIGHGFYLAPMATYLSPDSSRDLDDGIGATLGLGYRFGGSLALELAGFQVSLDPKAGGSTTDMTGGNLNLLLLLPESGAGFYGLIGAGYLQVSDQPNTSGDISGESFDLGVGYFFPLRVSGYDLAIRAEARARQVDNDDDKSSPTFNNGYVEALFNIGLQLPLGKRRAEPERAVEVSVVDPSVQCADGIDNDNDGLTDFPADSGCESAQDMTEGNAQCGDRADNDGDGFIDMADQGCADPQDNDETDPCREPVEGQPITLDGCGVGDVVVLHGVYFDFDKATLTANARIVLETVADALKKYPMIKVEIGGHTDSRGSEAYNQQLSERRAEAVRQFLSSKGIDAARMTAVGYGESRPVAGNDTDEGREQNRRVELTITEGVAR